MPRPDEQAMAQASQERDFLNAVLDMAGSLVVVLDPCGQIVRFNRACETATGYSFEEVRDRCFWDFLLVPEEAGPVRAVFAALTAGQFPNSFENFWVAKAGQRRRIAWNNTAITDAAGKVTYVVSSGQDITDRVAAEAALRRSEARARGILETAVDAIVTIDERGIIETFNPAAQRMFGYSAAEALGQSLAILMPAPFDREHDGYVARYLETGRAHVMGTGRELIAKRKDGSIFPIDLALGEQRLGDSRLFTGIIRDISERKRMEHEILEIGAREQRRIGQDLHDGVGQHLTGVAFLSKALAQRLGAEGRTEAAEVEKIVGLVNQAISETRQLARGLHPVEDAHGLVPALRELAGQLEETFKIVCVVHADAISPIHDMVMATHLYRIAQEAVHNAVRHGQARQIEISLRCAQESLRLMIRDDGKGFVPTAAAGMGLRTMSYRARMIGGVLDVRASPDGGTIVICRIDAAAPSFAEPGESP